MKYRVNLLPVASQRRFEHRRLGRFWTAIWLLSAGLLLAGHLVLVQLHRTAQRELDAAKASSAPIRRAEADIRRLQSTLEAERRNIELCLALEQTDVPLALLQVVGDSCRGLGTDIQLESLRVDELTVAKAPEGKEPVPRKQILLVGTADGDARVTSFVRALESSQAFQAVALEASQAQSEQVLSRRSFQIRCQQ